MPSLHAAALDANPSLRSAFYELESFIQARATDSRGVTDFDDFERQLHARVQAVERATLAAELAKLDRDHPVVIVHGSAYRQVVRCEQEYWTLAGPVRVMRTLYRDHRGDPSLCPLELNAGIIEGRWTPWAAELAAWVVAKLTPQDCEDLFTRIGGLAPSKSSFDRLPKKLLERWDVGGPEWDEELRAHEKVPKGAKTVSVSLDGVLIPMRHGERAEKRQTARRKGKQVKGPAGYAEASCATLSFYDADGTRLSTVQFARMPEHKKATLKEMLDAELAHVLAQNPHLRLVKLADGARDNWDYLDLRIPQGISILDFYHAAQHLRAALDEAYGETSPRGRAQFDKLRRILLEERHGVDKVIRSLVYQRNQHPRKKKLQAELTYFRRNRDKMRYAEFSADNLPIGSGVVEAACKTLVTQRLKRSGMRWQENGGQAILNLRSWQQSGRFERAWKILASTYRANVTVPEGVLSFPGRNAVSGVSA